MIENLLRNALDAMDGKGEISGNIREDDDRVLIDITDTGKGISARDVRRVFNPGFTTKQRGWGLGLSLVRRIVHEYHNGRIQVTRSQPGIGTTFTISVTQSFMSSTRPHRRHRHPAGGGRHRYRPPVRGGVYRDRRCVI